LEKVAEVPGETPVIGSLRIRFFPTALGALLLLSGHLYACNTPVFRYALERWEASPYLVVVCFNGTLTPEQEKRVEALGPGEAGTPQPNLEVCKVDLSKKDDAYRTQVDELLGEPLTGVIRTSTEPQVLILFPIIYGRKSPVLWTGSLDSADLKVLCDSPMRHEVARNLLLGKVAVWLQLESGDAEADRKAETVLRENLKRLEGELELPTMDVDEDPALVQEEKKAAPEKPEKPTFALLRMKPGAPEERMFEKMLRIDEFWKEKKAPLAFAIYGRGRSLAALSGDEINAEYLSEICAFLCGACSCQVKESNPGYDLLMTVDWYGGVRDRDEVEKALAPLISPTGLAAVAKAASEPPPATPADTVAVPVDAPVQPPSSVLLNALLFLAGLVILIVVASFLMRARRS
jgi:hypothetical protein